MMSLSEKNARQVALDILFSVERNGAWIDAALKQQIEKNNISSMDAAFITRICYGVLQNFALLDFYISQYSKTPVKKMETKVLLILRMGCYQILFMDKVPDSAAVNTSVMMAKKAAKNPRVSGLVNGILRKISDNSGNLPEIPQDDKIKYLSIRYSHPEWLVKCLIAEIGYDETEAFLCANNEISPTTAMVNRLRTDRDALTQELEKCGIAAQPHSWLDDCLLLTKTGDILQNDAWKAGKFYIQDPAAKLVALCADVKAGDRVIDVCSAPGGKSFAVAIETEDKAVITACDVYPNKVKLIEDGAERMGLKGIHTQCCDASSFEKKYENAFDTVIADIPCSGIGVIRKKPDIRFKKDTDIAEIRDLQKKIVDNVCRYVKKNGILIYSTCTVLKAENENAVAGFLKEHDDFRLEPFTLPAPLGECADGMVTLWPHKHDADGFFIAKLRKVR